MCSRLPRCVFVWLSVLPPPPPQAHPLITPPPNAPTRPPLHQAHALGRHMHSMPPTNGVQLVVVSPLTRTLETAAGVFGVDPSTGATLEPPAILLLQLVGGWVGWEWGVRVEKGEW